MTGLKKRYKKSSKAQAMVEFALIATVLLMLIFIVIEAARILWAWNTVQNSAREGIRYAITGQTLGNDFCPVDGFPKFDDNGRDVCNLGDNNRIASIIVRSHNGLSGLPLNETSNAFEDDNYYNIEIWGVNPEAEDGQLLYDFGGLPNYPVVVRVTYRVPIITPLLRPIAPSVPVFGQVALTNENFGSLSSGNVGQGLPPVIPSIPTPGVTPSPTPSPTATSTSDGPPPDPTETGTATATSTPAVCPVNFVQPPVADQTSVLVTGEIGATVEIWDITTDPETLLGTTTLLDRPGYLCGGFADFVPATHPALSIPLVSGHFIEVRQFVNGTLHSTDVGIVLDEAPTATPTETNTPAPTPTETGTPTVTPTNTPGSAFITLLPNCGGSNNIGNTVTVTVLGFNWPDDQDIAIFWDSTSAQTVILDENHNGSFSFTFTVNNIDPGTYQVLASAPIGDQTATYTVPCDNFVPTPVTSTPTNTPRPIDLVMVSPPEIVSSLPITAYTPVDFSVIITNTGDVDVNSQFFVDIYLDPTDVFTTHIPIEQSSGYSAISSLAGGESKVITITSQLGFENDPATHMVYGMVDSAGVPGQGQIFEPIETNNISDPAEVTGIISADTPTPTPTVDPSGSNIIAGTVNSRVVEWATQFRAVVTLIDSSGNIFAVTDSDENGYYQFLNVPDDTYTVYSCIDIDGIGYFGVRLGIVPPNPVANIYMLPGPCGVSTQTNQPPNVVHPGDQYNLEGDGVSLIISATDPENDTLTYSAIGLPPNLSINATTGEIFGTIANGFAGEYPVGVTVDDGTNQTSILFTWHVLADELRFETFRVLNVSSSDWVTVTTTNSYIDMVVVCSTRYPTSGTLIPRVVRVQNANIGNSFQVILQNPSGLPVSASIVDCMVMEAGTWQLPDGRNIEAQKYISTVTDRNGSWNAEAQTYGQAYSNPIVFGQVMTFNDPNWSVFWSRGNSRTAPPSSANLFTGKHIGQDSVTTRANETIGFIVVESGFGTLNSQEYRTALGGDTIRGVENTPPYNYTYGAAFSSTPGIAVVTQAAMDGGDGSWAYTYGPNPMTATQLSLANDEDAIGDAERAHTTEQTSYFVFEREIVLP
ncbi:MAG: putative Ig domain-containing protein [Chloroflexota bacterium]